MRHLPGASPGRIVSRPRARRPRACSCSKESSASASPYSSSVSVCCSASGWGCATRVSVGGWVGRRCVQRLVEALVDGGPSPPVDLLAVPPQLLLDQGEHVVGP